MTGPGSGRGSNFGDQVSDAEAAAGVGAHFLDRVYLRLDLARRFREPFPRRGTSRPRRAWGGRLTIRGGCAPTAKSGVVLAVTHVLPASKIQLHPAADDNGVRVHAFTRAGISVPRHPRGRRLSVAPARRPNRSATKCNEHKAHMVLSYRSGRDFAARGSAARVHDVGPGWHRAVVRIGQPAFGQSHPGRRTLPTPWAGRGIRERDGAIQPVQ